MGTKKEHIDLQDRNVSQIKDVHCNGNQYSNILALASYNNIMLQVKKYVQNRFIFPKVLYTFNRMSVPTDWYPTHPVCRMWFHLMSFMLYFTFPQRTWF